MPFYCFCGSESLVLCTEARIIAHLPMRVRKIAMIIEDSWLILNNAGDITLIRLSFAEDGSVNADRRDYLLSSIMKIVDIQCFYIFYDLVYIYAINSQGELHYFKLMLDQSPPRFEMSSGAPLLDLDRFITQCRDIFKEDGVIHEIVTKNGTIVQLREPLGRGVHGIRFLGPYEASLRLKHYSTLDQAELGSQNIEVSESVIIDRSGKCMIMTSDADGNPVQRRATITQHDRTGYYLPGFHSRV